MVNTGAMQSTFPPSQADLDRGPSKDAPSLLAANGSPIRCYGTRTLMGRSYSWPFAIADISRPLLSADFLAHHGLLVDVAGKRLINTGTCQSCALRAGPATISVSAVTTQPYADLLQEFRDVFKPELRQSPGSPSKHRIYHHITTTGPLTHAKFSRLPPQKLDTKCAFEDMKRMGICPRISGGHSEDCNCDTIRILYLRILNLRPTQCGGDLPTTNG
ncbi:uncharacterized protein [Palaemon carinicauda]|uniref:uncharacterized protein n=1 Tax=Palaemon carinicauda TaxID=392227 RepID=UPI0035B5B535